MYTNRRGFTLIELLVVISIIALLLSIVMPAMTKVREQGRTVVCANTLKQIGLAANVYSVDNRDELPLSVYFYPSHTGQLWVHALSKYLGGFAEAVNGYPGPWHQKGNAYYNGFYRCMSQKVHEKFASPWPPVHYLDFGMNTNINYGINNPGELPNYHIKFSQIKNPGNVLLFADGGGVANVGPGMFTPVPNDIPGVYSSICPRHGSKVNLSANISFVDGHASLVSKSSIPENNTGLWLPNSSWRP